MHLPVYDYIAMTGVYKLEGYSCKLWCLSIKGYTFMTDIDIQCTHVGCFVCELDPKKVTI